MKDIMTYSKSSEKKKKLYFSHPTATIDPPVSIGRGTKIWHYCHIMQHARIGSDCVIGQNVFVSTHSKIGNRVRLQNNVSVYDGITLEDDVFCGPSVVFTNDTYPRINLNKPPQERTYQPTLVKRGATLGANSTIVCGITIGEFAFIGAGSVVSKNVPAHALVYGNPAILYAWVCLCGVKVDPSADKCNSCHVSISSLRIDSNLRENVY